MTVSTPCEPLVVQLAIELGVTAGGIAQLEVLDDAMAALGRPGLPLLDAQVHHLRDAAHHPRNIADWKNRSGVPDDEPRITSVCRHARDAARHGFADDVREPFTCRGRHET